MANQVFSATFRDREVMRSLDELGQAGRTGIARALKRSGTTARAELARNVVDDTGLGIAFAKREITTSVDVDGGTVRIATAGFRLPLIQFSARGPQPSRGRKGTAVTAMRFGQRTRYEGAFIAKVYGALPSGVTSSGHVGVFRRRGLKRLPIAQLYGPSIAQVFAKFLPEAAERGLATLGKNLEHELQFALSRA